MKPIQCKMVSLPIHRSKFCQSAPAPFFDHVPCKDTKSSISHIYLLKLVYHFNYLEIILFNIL